MFELANSVFKKKNRAKKRKVEQKDEFDNQIKKDSMHFSDQSTIESPEIDFKKKIGEKRIKVEPKNEFDNQIEPQHSMQLRNRKIVKSTKNKLICSDCGASYVYKSGLQSHIKKKHSEIIYFESSKKLTSESSENHVNKKCPELNPTIDFIDNLDETKDCVASLLSLQSGNDVTVMRAARRKIYCTLYLR